MREVLTRGPCHCAGSFDRFLNVQISFIILLQLAMCAVHGSLSLWWRNKYGIQHYYLALDVQGQVRRISLTASARFKRLNCHEYLSLYTCRRRNGSAH